MSYFDDWDWNAIVRGFSASVPAAITGYFGARGVADANRRAAEIAEQNRQANLAAVTAGNERASGILEPIAAQAMPASQYLRTVMARNPYELTPQQETEQADRLRVATRSMPAAFRGSGRATSAVLNDTLNRGRAGMIDQNMRRADTAASSLYGTGAGATTNMANIASRGGAQIADINTVAAGDAANALTSTAAMNAKTLGDIAHYFASSVKDQERESRYGRTKARYSETG